jgi:nitrogen fixation-related uncharacterized protein
MILLLKVWVGYAICGAIIYSAVFIWAVRNRQFTELDRQRYLALNAEKLPEDGDNLKETPHFLDKYTWVAMLFLTFMMIAVALLLGWKGG